MCICPKMADISPATATKFVHLGGASRFKWPSNGYPCFIGHLIAQFYGFFKGLKQIGCKPWIQVAGWSVWPSRNSTTEFPFEDKLHIHIYIFIISEDFLSCWVFGSPPNTIPTILIKIRFSSPIGVSEICKTYQLLTLVKPFLAVRVRRWSSRLTRRKRDRSIQSWSLVTGMEYENINGISMGFNES